MSRQEFMQLKIADILEDFIKLHHLQQLSTPDEYIYVQVQNIFYGLP